MAKTRNTRSTKSKKSVQAKAPAPVATPVTLEEAPVVEAPVIEVAAAPVLRPSHDAIARRAFEIYLGRAGRPGNPLEDWFAAERELSSRAA